MTEKKEQHVINASGKRLGHIASEIAILLMGKNKADAVRNTVTPVEVKVENAGKLSISEKKRSDKTYVSYTGYPGGLREMNMERLIDKKGYSEVLRRAVYGMLPSNRLRAKRMKNLTVSE